MKIKKFKLLLIASILFATTSAFAASGTKQPPLNEEVSLLQIMTELFK